MAKGGQDMGEGDEGERQSTASQASSMTEISENAPSIRGLFFHLAFDIHAPIVV